MSLIAIRRAGPDDRPVLEAMLGEAVNWDPGRPALSSIDLSAEHPLWHYVEDWPRPGDFGFVAEAGDRGVGAVWARRFPWEDPGFGFVDERVPEITIGVDPGWRRQSIGSTLLRAVVAEARRHGHTALSLSVEAHNPALRLYLRSGFALVASANGTHTLVRHLR